MKATSTKTGEKQSNNLVDDGDKIGDSQQYDTGAFEHEVYPLHSWIYRQAHITLVDSGL